MTRVLLFGLMLLAGCDDMTDQPKQTAFRAPVPAQPAARAAYAQRLAKPPALTAALVQRGQDQYRQFCTPCHSELGDGRGMVVQRGFTPPPSYHDPRLVAAPTRHFVDVITNGYGAMYSFADRVRPADRWAIAAYIRALQRAGAGTPDDLSSSERASLP